MIGALTGPVGTITPWIRNDASTPLPFGWLICDGSTVVDSESPFNGKVIPDLRARFTRGHSTLTNANFAADTLYYAGGTVPTGGTDSNSLSHGHSTPSHSHTWSDTSTASQNQQTLPYWYGAFAGYSHTHTGSGTTNTVAPSTDSGLGIVDNRPAFTGLLSLIRIK